MRVSVAAHSDHLNVRHLVVRNGEQLRHRRVEAFAEKDVIWLARSRSLELHAEMKTRTRAPRHLESPAVAAMLDFSWNTPGSYGFAKLFEREQIRRERLAVSELRGAIAALGVRESRAGWPRHACRRIG